MMCGLFRLSGFNLGGKHQGGPMDMISIPAAKVLSFIIIMSHYFQIKIGHARIHGLKVIPSCTVLSTILMKDYGGVVSK